MTLILPEELKERAGRTARRQGLSMGAFVRQAIERAVTAGSGSGPADPFLTDRRVCRSRTPRDVAADPDA
jgi:hypothetical protein